MSPSKLENVSRRTCLENFQLFSNPSLFHSRNNKPVFSWSVCLSFHQLVVCRAAARKFINTGVIAHCFSSFSFVSPRMKVNVTQPARDTLPHWSNQRSVPPEETLEFVSWSCSFPGLKISSLADMLWI